MFIERIFLPIFEYEKTIPQFGQPCSDDIFQRKPEKFFSAEGLNNDSK